MLKKSVVTPLLYKFRISALVAILGAMMLLSGCQSNEERILKGSERDVYERAKSYLDSRSWTLAIDTLEQMEEYFPFGTYAEHAQLELIFAYFKAKEYESALAAADRFIRLHPRNANVDYAYYMRGMANYYNDSVFSAFFPTDVSLRDPGTAKDAFNHFSQLLSLFPDSSYALDARKRMIYLKNTLARAEINIANYYFKRGAYIAAANRGRWVVENLQETPAVPDGLAVMAQAYHLVEMRELSENAAKVLMHNYPNHPAVKGGKFNYKFGTDQKKSWVSKLTLGLFDKDPAISFDTRKLYNQQYNETVISPPSI